MNSAKHKERKSFSVILQTSHNQTTIGLQFLENGSY